MSKIKEDDKYLIKQPEEIPEEPSMVKNYVLTPGTCEKCTLEFNCRTHKKEILRFLKSLGLPGCGSGFMYKIEITEKSCCNK